MPRNGAPARARLVAAALDLVTDRGFDAVTTAAIADRAGVTERTYFRHFPDKRKVLFDGERRLADWVTEAIGSLPSELPTWASVRRMVDLVVPPLEAGRGDADRLAAVIEATPALRERAAAKEAHLVALITGLLVGRGAPEDDAELAARAAWGVLARALRAWRAAPGTRLRDHVDGAFATLGRLVTG